MNFVDAEFFDGVTSKPQLVRIEFTGRALTIHPADNIGFSYKMDSVKVQPKIGRIPRVLDLPGNACLHVTHHEKLEEILPHKRDFMHLLENNSKFVVGSFLGLGAFALLMYFVIIPLTAKLLAPKATELFGDRVTRETIAYLESTALMNAEKKDKYHDRLESIRSFEVLQPYADYKIILYSSPSIGANAFALPNNTIVVTSEFLDLVKDDLEVLAVLLHEIGHIREYHVMQRIIGDSMISMAMFALFGADWTSLPMVVLTTGYSRNVERDADMFAAQLLDENDLPPTLLAGALGKLEESHKDKAPKFDFLKYISSHPSTDERIEYLDQFKRRPNTAPQ